MDSSNKPSLHITDPLYQTRVASPLGELTLIASDHGVRRLLFPQQELIEHHAQMRSDHPLFTEVAAQLATYFAGERTRFELPLDLIGTELQRAVWSALAEIPYGETVSYGEQAKRLGRPSAARAVGAANGKNPVPILLPCHRVIGSNGSLTGFVGGLSAKAWLLALEQRQGVFEFR